jgi:hypothetical protein
MISVAAIDVATLAERLLDGPWRRELFEALEREDPSDARPLTDRFEGAVAQMAATPEQLREIVRIFELEHLDSVASNSAPSPASLFAASRMTALEELMLHPEMPEDLLLAFCERGAFIASLGHRTGPRTLLARVAELHAYPEAIVSLGLDLFQDPAVPVAEFAAFTGTYGRDAWMLRTLAAVDASDPAKAALYEGLLADFPKAAAYRARHLAQSAHVSTEHFDAFLDRYDAPSILVLLLKSPIDDPTKRSIVEARAAAHAHHPEIASEIDRRFACARAEAADLSAEAARKLFAAGDPEVLLVLAENGSTPRDLVEALAQAKGITLARRIRSRARATLTRRTT